MGFSQKSPEEFELNVGEIFVKNSEFRIGLEEAIQKVRTFNIHRFLTPSLVRFCKFGSSPYSERTCFSVIASLLDIDLDLKK